MKNRLWMVLAVLSMLAGTVLAILGGPLSCWTFRSRASRQPARCPRKPELQCVTASAEGILAEVADPDNALVVQFPDDQPVVGPVAYRDAPRAA